MANGKTLKVRFLNGTDFVQQKVIFYAKKWENYANIKFEFISAGDAEIRVSFTPNIGSWSQVGTDALINTNQNSPTMNFGWFDENTSEPDFRSTTIHEFEHSLGCIHEHQSPPADIHWNKPVVYDYYRTTQTPPWSQQKVDDNVFKKFTQAEITNSNFDRNSIMLYPIPPEFTTDGFSVGWNTDLSPIDIAFIQSNYPK